MKAWCVGMPLSTSRTWMTQHDDWPCRISWFVHKHHAYLQNRPLSKFLHFRISPALAEVDESAPEAKTLVLQLLSNLSVASSSLTYWHMEIATWSSTKIVPAPCKISQMRSPPTYGRYQGDYRDRILGVLSYLDASRFLPAMNIHYCPDLFTPFQIRHRSFCPTYVL